MIHQVQVFSCKPGTPFPSFWLQKQVGHSWCGHNSRLIYFPNLGCSGQLQGCSSSTLKQHHFCDVQNILSFLVFWPSFSPPLYFAFSTPSPKETTCWWLVYPHWSQLQYACYLGNLCLMCYHWHLYSRCCWPLRILIPKRSLDPHYLWILAVSPITPPQTPVDTDSLMALPVIFSALHHATATSSGFSHSVQWLSTSHTQPLGPVSGLVIYLQL